MGSSLMAQGLVAAYKTVNYEFQIHHLTTQFLQPGHGKLPLKFEVTRTNDAKNNAGRTVAISQTDKLIAIIVMSFIRRPILDNLSLNYQPKPPRVEEPIEDIDDTKFVGQGLIKAQYLGRKFGIKSLAPPFGVKLLDSPVTDPNASNFGDNKTYHWLKIPGISAERGHRIHHSGYAFHFLCRNIRAPRVKYTSIWNPEVFQIRRNSRDSFKL
jgi:acyl-CoA thioesterase II